MTVDLASFRIRFAREVAPLTHGYAATREAAMDAFRSRTALQRVWREDLISLLFAVEPSALDP